MDNNEQKPMKVQLEQPAPKSKPKKLKPKKSLMVGLVVMGSLLVVGAIVITFMLITKNSVIGSVQELKAAIEGRRAVNCAIEVDAGRRTVIQADKGWGKLKLSMDIISQHIDMLAIRDDANYTWYGGEKTGYKTPYEDVFANNSAILEGDEKNISLKCESNDKADFGIPSDVKFIDLGDSTHTVDVDE